MAQVESLNCKLVEGTCLIFITRTLFLAGVVLLVGGCEDPASSYGDLGQQAQSDMDNFYNEPLVDQYRDRSNGSLDGYEAVQMINGLLEPPGSEEGNCSVDSSSSGRIYRESTVPEPKGLPSASAEVNSLLPTISYDEQQALEQGYYTYGQSRKRYGTQRTQWRLLQAGKKLAEKDIVMGVGNISKAGGGRMPPHMSHRSGGDVDFRLVGPNGKAQRCNLTHPKSVTDSCYDRAKTFEMVKTLIDVDIRNVDKVLINDPELRNMINSYYSKMSGSDRPIAQSCTGHDNHIHMSWKN